MSNEKQSLKWKVEGGLGLRCGRNYFHLCDRPGCGVDMLRPFCRFEARKIIIVNGTPQSIKNENIVWDLCSPRCEKLAEGDFLERAAQLMLGQSSSWFELIKIVS